MLPRPTGHEVEQDPHRSRQSKRLLRHAQPLAAESSGLGRVARNVDPSRRNPHEGRRETIAYRQRFELLRFVPQPCTQPAQLIDDFADVGCGSRMDLEPDCAFDASLRLVPETVIPPGRIRVIGLAGKRRIEGNAPGQSVRVRTFDPGPVHVRERTFPGLPSFIHRCRRPLHCDLETHAAPALRFRSATPATISPTLPENSVNPPHPASPRSSAAGSSPEMSRTDPSRVK